MATGHFYVWVSMFSDKAIDRLVVALVRQGFQVEALDAKKALTSKGELSQLCALNVRGELPNPLPNGQAPQQWLMADIKKHLDAEKDSTNCCIVMEVGGRVTWNGEQLRMSEENLKKVLRPKKEGAEEEAQPPPETALDKIEKAID